MPDYRPGQILEASDTEAGDTLRIVIVAVKEDGTPIARTIAHRFTLGGPWEIRLGQPGIWDLSRFAWRAV